VKDERQSDDYLAYMVSEKWQAVRRTALARGGHRCAQCGRQADVEVHHLTYARLWHELPSDLTLLCKPHHEQAHRRSQWVARVNGYCSRRWGPDWQDHHAWEDGEEAFAAWLDRQD
jgi:5-methylcytosine-specific restriction endonuclease McrA